LEQTLTRAPGVWGAQNVQVLFVNCVAVWWNFVLSMTQHK